MPPDAFWNHGHSPWFLVYKKTKKPISKGDIPKRILVILWVYFLMQEYWVQAITVRHSGKCWSAAMKGKLIRFMQNPFPDLQETRLRYLLLLTNKGDLRNYYAADNHEPIISKEDWEAAQHIQEEYARERNGSSCRKERIPCSHTERGNFRNMRRKRY